MHKVHKDPIRLPPKQTTYRKLASFRLRTITHWRGTATGRQSDTSDKIRHFLQFSAIPRRFQAAGDATANATRLFFDAQSAQKSATAHSKQTTYRKSASFRPETITHYARHSHGAAIRHFRQNPTLSAIFRDPPALSKPPGMRRRTPLAYFFRCTKCTKIRYGPIRNKRLVENWLRSV